MTGNPVWMREWRRPSGKGWNCKRDTETSIASVSRATQCSLAVIRASRHGKEYHLYIRWLSGNCESPALERSHTGSIIPSRYLIGLAIVAAWQLIVPLRNRNQSDGLCLFQGHNLTFRRHFKFVL